jgi:hypothetical protein
MVPGIHAFGRLAYDALELRDLDRRVDGDHYLPRDLVLDTKNIANVSIVAVRPCKALSACPCHFRRQG